MELFAPSYYPQFHCIANRCAHSCCIGWEIDIDDVTMERYEALPGASGEAIRASIRHEGEVACFALTPEGKCPHLDGRGLCRIISELGDDYLSEICREHPRFYNLVGDHMECGVGAACEEAARLILGASDYQTAVAVGMLDMDVSEATGCDFDAVAWREQLFSLLSDATLSYGERLSAIASSYATGSPLPREARRELLLGLEYLDGAHRPLLAALPDPPDAAGARALLCERFFAYLVYRHASPAECEAEFRTAVGFALELERLFRALVCGDRMSPVQSAVMLSEELEYSEDNAEAIGAALRAP
ncbi:MAG: hypothetical protein E7663_06755 [Ruminococcaceae bacterium]|nr:hypothetical protein [Oscillospiraceae bacterium]